MREIKFRQWIKRIKQFHYFSYSDGFIQGPSEASLSINPIMQFTGLYDKNGKEIYEGDILSNDFDPRGVVVFIDNGFWLVRSNGDRHMPNLEYREIIGNIHENPELLK